jgi:type IV pilus assembly protein PilY1
MIYVGANDGMLHAFRDCNGSEAWAFIPQDLLGDLKLLPPALHSQYNSSGAHPYFVDGTPAVYTYDDDDDGNIESGDGDKVILLFGLRRGGAAYYALDVTNPENPIFLWRITPNEILRGNTVNTINSYGELGQTWSTPQLGKIKQVISGNDVTKIVAFVGAGYDNRNEDGRSGATERYSDTDVVLPTEDDGNTVSDRVDNDPAGALEAGYVTRSMTDTNDEVTNNPVGRGVYAIEIASLDNNGDPNFSNSGNRVWEFGYVGTSNGNGTGNSDNRKRMKHSIPSDITVADTNFDGYTDRLYVGDTGGQLWRLARHNGGDDGARPTDSPYIETWIGNRIFGANGSGSGGKKFFYRPSITFQKDHSINVYIGSGDREHPLNLNIVDRLYAIFDRGQITSEGIDEAELVNVTENLLQEDDSMANNAQVIADTLSLLTSSSKYGWYIKLDEHSGEKPVSDPLVFNKVAYYTTYAPDLSPPPDNCTPGNLGTARIYGINYLTGEAAHNWNEGNDNDGAIANSRAWGDNVVDGEGEALRRIDRVKTLGKGMPSKPEVPMSPGGEATLYIGTGGGLIRVDPAEGGTIIPIYWMVW